MGHFIEYILASKYTTALQFVLPSPKALEQFLFPKYFLFKFWEIWNSYKENVLTLTSGLERIVCRRISWPFDERLTKFFSLKWADVFAS